MTAGQSWRAMIEAEHGQSDRMRAADPPQDHWQPYAQQFVADPRRTDDPLMERLAREVRARSTVIDVGAGAGRLALPLALRCRHVVAVEPSEAMGSMFRHQAEEHGIRNVTLVQATWEDAEVEPADLVLCVHVVYTAREIEHFVKKLGAHGQERVLVVLFKAPPQTQIYPLWKLVHGEERLPLPGLPEFETVLKELGIDYHVEILPSSEPRGYDSPGHAVELLSQRLYLSPESDKRRLLETVLPELLVGEDGAFKVKDTRPLEPALVWWEPPGS